MATHNLILDTSKVQSVPKSIDTRVGEKGSCIIVAEIADNGAAMALAGYTARFECVTPAKKVVRDAKCSISGNTITYTLDQSVVSSSGSIAVAYFVLVKGSNVIETTENFAIKVLPNAESFGSGVPSGYYSEIDDLLALLEEQKQKYATAEDTRAASEARREKAEAARDSAESTRAENEKNRQSTFTTLKTAAEAATREAGAATTEARKSATEAQGAASNATSAANSALIIANSIATGNAGDAEFAAMRGQIEQLGYSLAESTNQFMLIGDTIFAPSNKASLDRTTVNLPTSSIAGTTITTV